MPLGLLASEYIINMGADVRHQTPAYSVSLPDNQWEREITLWFETMLATIQVQLPLFSQSVDRDSLGPFPQDFLIFSPIDSIESDVVRDAVSRSCYSNKMKSVGQYQNFNLISLVLIVGVSIFIIVISLVLEPLVGLFRRRFRKSHGGNGYARQLARDADGKYWLLGAALARAGAESKDWTRGGKNFDSAIPILTCDALIQPVQWENFFDKQDCRKEGQTDMTTDM